MQAAKEQLVIGDPVKRGGRQDRVDGLVQLQLQQIRSADVRVGAQPLAGGSDHRLGHVHRDHPSARQPLHQRLGDPARAAAGVEHRLVAGERQPVEHGLAQRLHRPGDPVIALARPSYAPLTYIRTLSRMCHTARAASSESTLESCPPCQAIGERGGWTRILDHELRPGIVRA